MKRLGVLLFFDKDGIADDYILYMLEKFKEHTDELLFICNGDITEDSYDKVSQFVAKIYKRENAGYDAGGWKDFFTGKLDNIDLSLYDEICIFNDSFYGPVYPLSEMFDEMDSRAELDFWGITMHGKAKAPKDMGIDGCIPVHIQSYFLAIRKTLLSDDRFLKFWEEMENTDNLKGAINNFELMLTKTFEDLGYKWDVYAKADHLMDNKGLDNYNLSFYTAEYLLREKRLPFIKRKTLYDSIDLQMIRNAGSVPQKCVELLKNETEYPVDYIKKHLIRVRDVRELYEAFNFDFILPEQSMNAIKKERSVALIMHLYYPELFSYCAHYAASMPNYADIYITTSRTEYCNEIRSEFAKAGCRNITIIEADNRGRDIGGLIVAARPFFMNYEYVCFIHDKKSLGMKHPEEGEHFCEMLFRGMLESKGYVENILSLFEKDPFLGVLSPPIPIAGNYLRAHNNLWVTKDNYENMLKIKEMLKLECNISYERDPLTIGSAFWCRTDALKKLMKYEWTYEDFPEKLIGDKTMPYAIERCFAYVAQDAGYYTGIAYPNRLAEEYFSIYSYMYRSVLKELYKFKDLSYLNYNSLIKMIRSKRIQDERLRKIASSTSYKIGKTISYVPRIIKSKILK